MLLPEPQPHLHTLVDPSGLRRPPLTPGPDGLEIVATCTLAELVDAGVDVSACRMEPGAVRCGDVRVPLTALAPLTARSSHDGTPRSVAFTVHAFRVAVDPGTGEVAILRSVQAVDAGTVINPEQLRGQVEGGVAQAIGTALFEELVLDRTGLVTTSVLRNYHVPQFADLPRTEVLFAETVDHLGPFGAKSMSEAPYNPVAPALANAVRDAIGVRPTRLPMTRDRIWRSVGR